MKLSQIKLSGFKSFVDPTSIQIKGQLIGIVGPNGCGKSNVIDAVRWVLGESSAKQLRGESMHDVIFNGSVNRKPVSRASVELVFDNQQKILSNAWSRFDEISIKRLISRSGESVYSINNQTVRRRDITELFLGTGVGSRGYAVIEQGMISRIIEARPDELRLYLEEAAGVSKYREKRKETLSRLEDTRENLVRLEDLKSQMNENIEVLSIQAKSALHYQELNARIKQLQLIQLLLKINNLQKSLNMVNLEIENIKKSLEKLTLEYQASEKILNDTHQQKHQEEQKLSLLNHDFNQLRSHLARLEERHKYKVETKARLINEEGELQRQLSEINLQLENGQNSITEINHKLDISDKRISEQEQQRQGVALSDHEQSLKHSTTALAQVAAKVANAVHELNLLNNSVGHKQQQLRGLEVRLVKLQQELPGNTLGLEDDYTVLKENIAELDIELEELSYMVEDKKSIRQDLALTISAMTELLNKHKMDISGINAKISTLEHLLKQSISVKFESLRQVLASDDSGSAYTYNSADSNYNGITSNYSDISTIWQEIEVKPGYEVAVEIALGQILSGFVIDDLSTITKQPDGMLCLWYGQGAGSEEFSNTSFNERLRTSAAVPPLLADTLANFVTIAHYRYQLLHNLLSGYYVVANFELACELLAESNKYLATAEDNTLLGKNGVVIVTLDGHVVTNDYIIFNANHGQSHVLEQQNQLQELTGELEIQQQQLVQQEQKYKDSKERLNLLDMEIKSLEQKHKDGIKAQHALQLELVQKEQNYRHSVRHHEKISNELVVLNKEIEYIKGEISQLTDTIVTQQEIVDETRLAEDLAKDEHRQIEADYLSYKEKHSQISQQINQMHMDKQLLQQQLNLINKQLLEKTGQIDVINLRITKIQQELQQFIVNDDADEIVIVQDQITNVVHDIEVQNECLQRLNGELSSVTTQRDKLAVARDGLSSKLNKAQLSQQEYVLTMQNLQENIANLQPVDYVAEQLLADNKLSLVEINKQITLNSEEVAKLGLVNLKAIEDLEQTQSKFAALNLQMADLVSANNSLESAIKQIDGESRKLLNDTYTKVNTNFEYYFKILFGGGTAQLIATEDDILVSGLQICAQPLGKRNTSLYLLSGGEKTLTAMSLVFAFFNLNPSPFCMLDEVDAPLDDANTLRFCNLVRELSNNTQFVCISHNRLTMENAHQLIGVTMQEKGVSTVVPVNLIDWA
ncbi:MAG: chromosome segregation protein [Pseudomonadota bacterium]|nr:chromosome segregation protein [Pseudomonadota bacterium]